MGRGTDALSHGSYLGTAEAFLNWRMSKPVMFGFSPCATRSGLCAIAIASAHSLGILQKDDAHLEGCIVALAVACPSRRTNSRIERVAPITHSLAGRRTSRVAHIHPCCLGKTLKW